MNIENIENYLALNYYKSLQDYLIKDNIEHNWLIAHIKILNDSINNSICH